MDEESRIEKAIEMTNEGEAIGATDVARGIARVKAAIELWPDGHSGYLVLARLYYRNGQYELAKSYYEKLLAMWKLQAEEEARTWADKTKRRTSIPVAGPAYQLHLREYEDFKKAVAEAGQEVPTKVKKP